MFPLDHQNTNKLTDMLNSLATLNPRTKVSPHGSLKYLHHEAEQRTRQGSVPSTFGTLVADEGMLSLYLQELKWH
jgi:hypothetical protein